jgi:hypothetical protein
MAVPYNVVEALHNCHGTTCTSAGHVYRFGVGPARWPSAARQARDRIARPVLAVRYALELARSAPMMTSSSIGNRTRSLRRLWASGFFATRERWPSCSNALTR